MFRTARRMFLCSKPEDCRPEVRWWKREDCLDGIQVLQILVLLDEVLYKRLAGT